jgi:uncharacterized protein YciI
MSSYAYQRMEKRPTESKRENQLVDFKSMGQCLQFEVARMVSIFSVPENPKKLLARRSLMQMPLFQKLLVAGIASAGVVIFSKSHEAASKPIAAVAQTADAAKLFIIHFTIGENWDKDKPANEQKYFKHHSENLRALRAEDKLLLGARYADKGMIIVKAAGEAEARKFIEQDSTVIHHVFNFELHPFKPFYYGCIESK